MSRRRKLLTALLAALAAAALALRLPQALAPSVLAAQEIRYVWIAEALASGRAYAGESSRYPDILQPPLFPALAAAASPAAPSPAAAARAVSAILGALAVLPAFRLGRRLHSRSAGLFAAAIAAFHPALAGIARAAVTEATYVFLLLSGLAAALAAIERPGRAGRAAGAAGLLGLAYLTRPEGLVHAGVFVAALGLTALRPAARCGPAGARGAWRGAAAAALVAASVTGAYVAWLHARSGLLGVAPKGSYAMAIVARREAASRAGVRMPEGTLYEKLRFELDAEGTEFAVRPLDAARPEERPSTRYLLRFAARNLRGALGLLARSRDLLPWPVAAFALIGAAAAIRRGRSRPLAYLAVGLAAAFTFVLAHVLGRFLLPAAALLVPVAGAGAAEAARLPGRILRRRPRRAPAAALAPAAVALLALGPLAPDLAAVKSFADPPDEGLREAGAWVRAEAGAGRAVMAVSEVAAYYAEGRHVPLPYEGVERTLRFAALKGVEFVVLDRHQTLNLRPDLAPLLDPDAAFGSGGAVWRRVWAGPPRGPHRAVVLAPAGRDPGPS